MAVSFVGESHLASAGSGASAVLSRPDGTLDTDLVLIATYRENQVDPNSVPSGFSAVGVANWNGSPAIQARVYAGLAGAASSYTVGWSGAAWRQAGLIVLRGQAVTNPLDVVGTFATDTASGGSVTAPGITTLTAASMLVPCWFIRSGGTTWGMPSGITAGVTGIPHVNVGYGLQAAAGASGDKVATVNLNGVRAGLLIAVKPEPTASPMQQLLARSIVRLPARGRR